MGNEKPKLNDPPSSRLSESEANRRLEDFTRLVSNWIWEVDREFKITFISDRVFEVLGLHPQELIGQSLADIIAFEFSSSEELRSLLSRPFRDRPSTATTPEGETCHLLISGIPVFNLETGDFEGVRGTANDVTARIQTEKKLLESEQHYRSLIEFQRTGILVYRDYKIVFANASAVRIFGAASLEDLLGRTSLDLTHPDFHDLIKERRLEVEETQSVQDFMELIHFRVDGSEFYALDNAASILWEDESAVLVSVSDISETKDAERAAALSENRFKQFAESAADIFWESDAEHRYSFISPLPANLPALAKDFPIGLTPWETEAIKPDGVDWAEHRSVLDAQKPFRNFHYEVIDTIGNTRYLSRNGSPQFDENGEFSGYRGTIIDQTEHVLAREKIATIQHQFFTAIENFSEGFALWDANGIFVYCNSYYRITHPGAQKHLLPGKSYQDFIRAYANSVNVKPRDSLDDWVQRRVDEFSPNSTTKELFLDNKWVEVRKHRLKDGSSMAIYTDITEQKEQERALQSSEDRLHLITDAIPAMIAYHDLDLRFEFANKNFETIGLDSKAIIGEKIEDVFPPDIYAQILPNIEKSLAGESVTYDNFFPTQDGEGVITQVSLIPDFDDAGDVRGLFVLSFDITERKTAEEEIEKTNMALDAAQSIAKIGSWDKEFSSPNMTWSEEHCRIFGLDPTTQTIAVNQFLDLIHPDDRDAVIKFLPRDLSNIDPSFSIDYRIQRPDGTERFVHGEGETIYDAQHLPVSFRGTSQDITDRKRSEEALDQARREAEFANKAKSEFLSSMSHELRTPLNAILGYAQLLLQTKKDPLQGRQTKQVNQILVSGQHLLKLINDILDLAKIESGHVAFELTDVDIFEAIEECVSLIASLAERHNIRVNLTGPFSPGQVIRADRTRFKQALLNLLSNAIKYNKPNGSVEVKSYLTDKQTIRISVEDFGIGIPIERQPEIFEPFSRLGAEQKGIEGTGIGLTITKQLVELMDGQIGFFSAFDEGSTFWIELPASSPGNSLDSEQIFSEDGLEQIGANLESKIYTLLYIEDDTSNLHLMEELIDNIPNLSLISAISAEEGLEIAKSQHPDIIFMDINLPGISGLDAMSFLKKDPKTSVIPVIALSAAAMPHDLLEGQKVGFFNYLTKPFDIGEVLANINEALELNTQITYGNNSS